MKRSRRLAEMRGRPARRDGAQPEKLEPIDRAIAILTEMEAMDLKANSEEMESKLEHREVLMEGAEVKSLGAMKK
jgi:hypothetical protein